MKMIGNFKNLDQVPIANEPYQKQELVEVCELDWQEGAYTNTHTHLGAEDFHLLQKQLEVVHLTSDKNVSIQ